jgi:SH3 domain protein
MLSEGRTALWHWGVQMTRRVSRLLAAAAALGMAGAAAAETAWVKDSISLNLRTGPSGEHRILGTVVTGDSVEIVERGEGWILVRSGEIEGWMPAGFLQAEEPARNRLARIDADTAALRENLDRATREVGELREQKTALTDRETTLQAEVTRLGGEVERLRAGARWPECIAGASILGVGLVLGVILQWSSGRRGARRIRL